MAHEQYVLDQGYDFAKNPPSKAVRIFEGTAGEAAAHFPRHFNVAVSLSLAGIGFDRTRVEVWVDPDIPGAIHQLEVAGEEITLSMTSRNRPSENPKTSRIVAPSIIAALRAMVAPVTVGS
jgi:aspartate dehydrogenase